MVEWPASPSFNFISFGVLPCLPFAPTSVAKRTRIPGPKDKLPPWTRQRMTMQPSACHPPDTAVVFQTCGGFELWHQASKSPTHRAAALLHFSRWFIQGCPIYGATPGVLEASADPRKSHPLCQPKQWCKSSCALWTNFAQPKQRSTSFKSCMCPAPKLCGGKLCTCKLQMGAGAEGLGVRLGAWHRCATVLSWQALKKNQAPFRHL